MTTDRSNHIEMKTNRYTHMFVCKLTIEGNEMKRMERKERINYQHWI